MEPRLSAETMCYLRWYKLEPQNRIYSNEALSAEKPRVLGTLADSLLIAGAPLVASPTLAASPVLAVPLPPTTRKEA